MKLLFIYGPPAAGKLTVAQEISEKLGYRVFHNHLTIELAREIFPENNCIRSELINKLRLDMIEAASQADINLIFTFVYASGSDDAFVNNVVQTIESNGGEICFVQLYASPDILEVRLKEESRLKYSKIKNPDTLKELLDKCDLFSPIDHINNLSIDNANKSSQEAANEIIRHFDLKSLYESND